MKNPVSYVNMALGSPRAGCKHFGVCEINMMPYKVWATYLPPGARRVKAVISRTESGAAGFFFPKEAISPTCRAEFFSEKGFRVDAPKALPPEVADAIGLSGFVIAPGLYPIDFQPDGLQVAFGQHAFAPADVQSALLVPCNEPW